MAGSRSAGWAADVSSLSSVSSNTISEWEHPINSLCTDCRDSLCWSFLQAAFLQLPVCPNALWIGTGEPSKHFLAVRALTRTMRKMSSLRHVSGLTAKPEICTHKSSLEVTKQDIGRWLMALMSQHMKQQEEGRKEMPGRSFLATKRGLSWSRFNQKNAKL